MPRRIAALMIWALLLCPFAAAQDAGTADLASFKTKLDRYVEMHRRLEGPIPPLAMSPDMDEVHRLMEALQIKIRAERKDQGQGYLLTPRLVEFFREQIASCLTVEEIADTMADVEEHTPPDMPPPRVNEPLPEGAPFGLVPPRALRTLPRLPPELRYVVLANALLIWDHHADLVVDMAPGAFDAATYRERGEGAAASSIANGLPAQTAVASQPEKAPSDMSAKCQATMAEHAKMMAEIEAADQRLDTLVSKMNAASGDEKTDATAAVVSEIVAQRRTLRERMMNMHQNMMRHMAEHMQAGPKSMGMCPMMKGQMKH